MTNADKRGRSAKLNLARLMPLVVGVLASLGPIQARAADAPPAATDASVVAQRLWGKLLNRCGESAFYAGSVFDSAGMISRVPGSRPRTMEFRGMRFNAVPITISPAERLNGVASRTRITMLAQVYREVGERWSDGPAFQPRNTEDILGRAIGMGNADMFDMGTSGVMALELVKYQGKWFVSRSSASRAGSISFSGGTFYEVDKVIAAPAARYDCQSGKVIPRPPTPEEAAVLAEEAKQKAEADRRAAQRAQDEAARQQKERSDRAEMASFVADRDKAEAAWRFEGGAGVFSARLASNLIKRGQQYGFNPMEYAGEIAAINAIVHRCMKITPSEWKAAEDEQRRRIGLAAQGSRLPGPMMIKNEMLQGCDNPSKFRVSPPGKLHGLTVQRQLSTIGTDQRPVWSGEFRITVMVEPTPEDYDRAGRPEMLKQGAAFNIIDGHLPTTTAVAGNTP